jgi:starvation-inducible DNA-binding protein
MLSGIDDETGILPAEAMAAELLQDSEKMSKMFQIVFAAAEELGEHGLSNFLADRQDAHDKHSWMLRSTLK